MLLTTRAELASLENLVLALLTNCAELYVPISDWLVRNEPGESMQVNGANIEAKDRFGQTVLHAVARVDAAELLLDKGADIEVKDDAGKTALEIAVWKPNTALIGFQ